LEPVIDFLYRYTFASVWKSYAQFLYEKVVQILRV